MRRIVKVDFLKTYLEERKLEHYYNSITNNLSGRPVYTHNSNGNHKQNKVVYRLIDFPGYLKAEVNTEENGWCLESVNTFKGTCIDLSQYEGLEEYLKSNFSPKRRSKLKTYQKRLEEAFPIRYVSYCGEMSYDEYTHIFVQLRHMIERRSVVKNIYHDDYELLDQYFKLAYPLILKKEAVLFVIYHDEKPISIALNLIYNKLMYSYIRGFDVDYSKFYPGFVDFVIQIKWAFDNKIEVFDLLKGHYEYKNRLINLEYHFQRQIIYNRKSFISRLIAKFLKWRIIIFYFLVHLFKKIKVHLIYHEVMKLYDRKKIARNSIEKKYIVEKLDYPQIDEELNSMDISIEENNFLRRPIYDFLYSARESLDNIKVFPLKDRQDSYLIKGTDQQRLITFPNS